MLLQPRDDSGYPVEYLATRIGVRKSRLIRDWQPVLSSENPLEAIPSNNFLSGAAESSTAGVWQAMLKEYRWVFRQLDDTARHHFLPFFVWLELKTVILCLRNLQARREHEIALILESSMLSSHIRELFADGSDPGETIRDLEPTLTLISSTFCGAADTFDNRGTAGLERWLEQAWLRWAAGSTLASVLHRFYRAMVDFRNIMRLYKTVRWEVKAPPHFLPGGSIARTSFSEALASGEREDLAALVQRFTGRSDTDLSTSPEKALLEAITSRLWRGARVWSEYGRILEYLWCVYLETRNMGILLTAATREERQSLTTELLR